jgi:hypothetical protein
MDQLEMQTGIGRYRYPLGMWIGNQVPADISDPAAPLPKRLPERAMTEIAW